jgi:D-glycero-D-manno-heptose 1,7-bisphosphate phosphatase
MKSILPSIDHTWTLFLDRDGVINVEITGDYVNHWKDFNFYPGAAEGIANLRPFFSHIIVVTNQRGIARGRTRESDLIEIHQNLSQSIIALGGKIDQIYFCPDLDAASPNRKPQPGMALMAIKDFPKIDFNRSIMVGNTLSDMRFGKNLGMFTVFIPSTHPEISADHSDIDMVVESLQQFSELIANR